mmetsp:Transcript_89024/g.203643  ORF Transcript_89024/g.203643 Transcript_89024/m.203643 type:complete len:297 (+) Transcript_89024:424-1314(+)
MWCSARCASASWCSRIAASSSWTSCNCSVTVSKSRLAAVSSPSLLCSWRRIRATWLLASASSVVLLASSTSFWVSRAVFSVSWTCWSLVSWRMAWASEASGDRTWACCRRFSSSDWARRSRVCLSEDWAIASSSWRWRSASLAFCSAINARSSLTWLPWLASWLFCSSIVPRHAVTREESSDTLFLRLSTSVLFVEANSSVAAGAGSSRVTVTGVRLVQAWSASWRAARTSCSRASTADRRRACSARRSRMVWSRSCWRSSRRCRSCSSSLRAAVSACKASSRDLTSSVWSGSSGT